MRGPTLPTLLLATVLLFAGCMAPADEGTKKTYTTPTATTDAGVTGAGGDASGGDPPVTSEAPDEPPPTPTPTTTVAPEIPRNPLVLPRYEVAFELGIALPDPTNPTVQTSRPTLYAISPSLVNVEAPALLNGSVLNDLNENLPDQTFVIPGLNVSVGPLAFGATGWFEVAITHGGEYEYYAAGPEIPAEQAEGVHLYRELGASGAVMATGGFAPTA